VLPCSNNGLRWSDPDESSDESSMKKYHPDWNDKQPRF